ncbi:MAG: electron transfer flavoprotein subunit beta/FixA family protein [Candidatus Dormibacteria bacterium]
MHIAVILKQVPDLVEEVEVDASGTDIDRDSVKWKLNEFDDHALEQAILLKEAGGAEVTAVAMEGDGVDQVLYAALARGADRALKVPSADERTDAPRAAAAVASVLRELAPDLVLTGVQAADDLHGQLAPILATTLGWPHVSVVSGVEVSGATVQVQQEYSGGRMATLAVQLPAVLGVQAATRPPRYVPISRLRQIMASAQIGSAAAGGEAVALGTTVTRLAPPAQGAGAQMWEGKPEEIAQQLVDVLRERGLLGA